VQDVARRGLGYGWEKETDNGDRLFERGADCEAHRLNGLSAAPTCDTRGRASAIVTFRLLETGAGLRDDERIKA
jgi:hypothetical protein